MTTDDPDEPRVKDMDPATIAQLASWFDRPSFDGLEADPAGAPPAPMEPSDAEKIQAHRKEVLAQIDLGLLDYLERHRDDAERLRRVPPPELPWHLGKQVTLFDDSTLPPPFDPYDAPEVEVPMGLIRDLKICTPQAFLRDLYRPEKEYWIQLRSPWDDDQEEPPPADLLAPVRAVIAADYRPPSIPPSVVSIAASHADLKGLLAQPWPNSKRGPARAREEELSRKLAGGEAVSREPEDAS